MQCYNTLKPDVKKEFNNLLIILNIVVFVLIFRLILLCMLNILNLKEVDIIILIVQCCIGAFSIICLIFVLLDFIYDNKFERTRSWTKYILIGYISILEFGAGFTAVLHIVTSKKLSVSSIKIYHYIVLALAFTPVVYLIVKYVIILPIIYACKYIIKLHARVYNRTIEQELETPS